MSQILRELTILIPVDRGDTTWKLLLDQLRTLEPIKEIIISSVEPPPTTWVEIQSHFAYPVIWLTANRRGRAYQLNAGAQKSTGSFLWFLHSDSQLNPKSLQLIEKAIQSDPDSVYYFNLKYNSKLILMRLNEFGAWIRSRFFKLPFGDQSFSLSKKNFDQLGRFNEKMALGEDLHFIQKCHQYSVKVKSLNTWILTSPRKYEIKGWLKTTLNHIYLTFILTRQFKRSRTVAVAVFVKTLGFSSFKTRLAKVKGQSFAENFYQKSVECTRELIQNLRRNVQGYWAVAEEPEKVSGHWSDQLLIGQGQGNLGQRLHKVYSELLQIHDNVILIGSDSPQLTTDVIYRSIELLKSHDFVVGRALDGGFYLFAGKREIDSSVWLNVSYSVPTTANELIQQLDPISKPAELEVSFDVDEAEDLAKLKRHFEAQSELSASQQKLYQLIDSL